MKHLFTLLLAPVAVVGLLGMGTPAAAGRHPASHPQVVKAAAAAAALPTETLPYTFVCPDCGIKITIKTPADWNKDCSACACGKKNVGCYHDRKK